MHRSGKWRILFIHSDDGCGKSHQLLQQIDTKQLPIAQVTLVDDSFHDYIPEESEDQHDTDEDSEEELLDDSENIEKFEE